MASRQASCILTGVGCAVLALCWQFLTVHFNYQGRWNALFCTGEMNSQPPELANEHLYLFTGSQGYDGQMYHYVAHDPFFVRGLDMYVDAPRERYRRILIPLASHLLALGRDERVDAAYIAVVGFAIFCGGYWLSLYASAVGFHPALGLAFLLIPATLISIDRLTVDVGLAALCIAFALLVARESRWRLFGVLLLAPLVRETGFLLLAGYVLSLLWRRQLRFAMIFSTSALPALVWYAFVQIQTGPEDFTAFSRLPFQGIAERLAAPYQYPFGFAITAVSTLFDYAALAGVILAVALAIRMGWQRLAGPVEFSIYCFAVFAAFIYSPGAWAEVYAFGRTLSPLLILLALYGASKRNWTLTLPLLLVIPRTAIQFAPQVIGVLRKAL